MTRLLIIEDEARAAREMAAMLKAIDADIEILAILDSVEQSIQWLSTNKPDLIFSDIQLADGLCFEIYNKVQVQSPIIFCTAFDDYLMNAFDTHAVSYLMKPIMRQKFEKALDKFYSLKTVFEKQQQQTGVNGLLEQLRTQYKTALLVHERDKIIPIQVTDIAFFYLDSTLLTVTTFANKKYHVSSSLDELEKSLNPSLFYRANRQFLINRTAIINAERFFARKLVVRLSLQIPETVVISKAKASDFLQWLAGL